MNFDFTNYINSPLFLPMVFLVGIFSGLYSCSLLEIPFLTAMISSKVHNKKEAFAKSLAFVIGLVTSYVIIGVFISQIARYLSRNAQISSILFMILGSIGLIWGITIIFSSNQNQCCHHHDCDHHDHKSHSLVDKIINKIKPTSFGHIFLIGSLFAWIETPICPCCGPVIYVLSALTVAKGQLLFGVLTFALYSIGQGIPVIIITVFMSHIILNPKFIKSRKYFEIILGNILVFLGVLFIWLA